MARGNIQPMYAIWNLSSGNAVGGYETEEAAWSVVRTAYEMHGPEYVRNLAIEVEDEQSGEAHAIAQGEALVQFAGSLAHPEVTSR